MTSNSKKVRALVLSALMVFSVFAGTIAFAGTAAAVDSVSGDSNDLSNTPDELTSDTGEIAFNVTNVSASDSTVTSEVSVTNAEFTSIDSADVSAHTGSAEIASSAQVTNDGNITVGIDTDTSEVNATITLNSVTVEYANVDGNTDAVFSANVSDDGDGSTASGELFRKTVQDTTSSGSGDIQYATDERTDVDRIYAGQSFNVSGLDGNTEYELRSVDGTEGQDITSSTFIAPYESNNSGYITGVSTSDLETGDYYIAGDNVTATFNNSIEIVEQSFSAEFDEDSVDNEDSTTVDLNVDSNRNDFDVIVESESFDYDDDELEDIFDESGDVTTTTNDDDEFVIQGVSGDFATNFSGIDAGEYDFTFTVEDTEVEDSASITVEDVGEGEADLAQSTTTVTQGDIAEITVNFNDAASDATLVIGDEENDGYQVNVSLTDDSEDGQVTVGFNTYTAGDTTVSDDNLVRAVGDSASNDDVVSVNASNQSDLSDILDSGGDYTLSVGTNDDPAEVLDSPDNVGTLVVSERPAPEQTLWRTSQDTLSDVQDAASDDDVDTVGAITDAVENDAVTETDTLAVDPDGSNDDVLVHEVSAPGLSGVLGNYDGAGDVTSEFESAVNSYNEFGDANLSVVLEEQNPGANRDPAVLNLSSAINDGDLGAGNGLTVIADGEGSYYVFIDYSQVDSNAFDESDRTFEDGDEVSAGISVQDPRLLDLDDDVDTSEEASDHYETTSANFSVEESEGNFDLNADDVVAVTASEEAEITGSTNVAPGTTFTVRARSGSDVEPRFFETQEVTVQADGSFTATFDLSDQAAGDTFTASVQQAAFSLSEDGEIVESMTATPTATATATATPEPDTETATATPTATATATPTATATEAPETDEPTDTATAEPDTTTTTTPGFGVAVALVALLAAALLAGRRE